MLTLRSLTSLLFLIIPKESSPVPITTTAQVMASAGPVTGSAHSWESGVTGNSESQQIHTMASDVATTVSGYHPTTAKPMPGSATSDAGLVTTVSGSQLTTAKSITGPATSDAGLVTHVSGFQPRTEGSITGSVIGDVDLVTSQPTTVGAAMGKVTSDVSASQQATTVSDNEPESYMSDLNQPVASSELMTTDEMIRKNINTDGYGKNSSQLTLGIPSALLLLLVVILVVTVLLVMLKILRGRTKKNQKTSTDGSKCNTTTQNDSRFISPEVLMKKQCQAYKQGSSCHAHAPSNELTLLPLLFGSVLAEPDYAIIADAANDGTATASANQCGFNGEEIKSSLLTPSVLRPPLASGENNGHHSNTTANSINTSGLKYAASYGIKAETVTSIPRDTHHYEVEDWITPNHSQVGASMALSTGNDECWKNTQVHALNLNEEKLVPCKENSVLIHDEHSVNEDSDTADSDLNTVPMHFQIKNSTESIETMLNKLEQECGIVFEAPSSHLNTRTNDAFVTNELSVDDDYDHLDDVYTARHDTKKINRSTESIETMLGKLEQECEHGIVSEVLSSPLDTVLPSNQCSETSADEKIKRKDVPACMDIVMHDNDCYVTTVTMKGNPAYGTHDEMETSTTTPSQIELTRNQAYGTTINAPEERRKRGQAATTAAAPPKGGQDNVYQELIFDSLDYDYVIV